MPKTGEKSRKIKLLKQGKRVRSPKRFWDKLYRILSKEYPHRSSQSRKTIVGGIWNNYSIPDKIEIIKKYQ